MVVMDQATLVIRRSPLPTPGLPSPAPSTTGSSSDHASLEVGEEVRVRRKPIPRKGHTKSRNGCLHCKRRKVKCQETLPECANCRRLGLGCEYPSQRDTSPAPTTALQSTGGQFTMEDLQFFHHFLFYAYPPLPLKSETVWQEVASLSHHFDFLIHAMLGLAASHLSLSNSVNSNNNVNYNSQALTHRVSAIEALNRALSKPCSSKAEADALYGTVMALAFQSSYMLDGMLEFISMIRGCTLVGDQSMQRFTESLFRNFSTETHIENVQEMNGFFSAPTEYSNFFKAALVSVKALQPLCRSMLELRYLAIIDSIIQAAKISSVNGFLEISVAYTVFGEASAAEFNGFVDPDNYAAQIILVHFFIVEYVIGLETLRPIMDSFPFRGSIVASWTRGVAKNVPPEYKKYMDWPMSYVQLVEAETSGFRWVPKTLELGKIIDYQAES